MPFHRVKDNTTLIRAGTHTKPNTKIAGMATMTARTARSLPVINCSFLFSGA